MINYYKYGRIIEVLIKLYIYVFKENFSYECSSFDASFLLFFIGLVIYYFYEKIRNLYKNEKYQIQRCCLCQSYIFSINFVYVS